MLVRRRPHAGVASKGRDAAHQDGAPPEVERTQTTLSPAVQSSSFPHAGASRGRVVDVLLPRGFDGLDRADGRTGYGRDLVE